MAHVQEARVWPLVWEDLSCAVEHPSPSATTTESVLGSQGSQVLSPRTGTPEPEGPRASSTKSSRHSEKPGS